jgi:two-component system, OmpR family, response regulator
VTWTMDTLRRPRILYVDDNPDVTDSAVELLRMIGFEAVASYDGPHALAVALDFVPDVCVLDLNMPAMSGDELARQLTAQFAGRNTLFVAVTARGDAESLRRMSDAGVSLLFVKPVDPHDLIRVIEGYWRALSETRKPNSRLRQFRSLCGKGSSRGHVTHLNGCGKAGGACPTLGIWSRTRERAR